MSMSPNVVGFRPPDEAWEKHKAVWAACKAAEVAIPEETLEFFDGEDPLDKPGAEIDLEDSDCCSAYSDELGRSGFELDVERLPTGLKIIRFFNSW